MPAQNLPAQRKSRALRKFLTDSCRIFLPPTEEGYPRIVSAPAVMQYISPNNPPADTDPANWTVRMAITRRWLFKAAYFKEKKFRGAFEV